MTYVVKNKVYAVSFFTTNLNGKKGGRDILKQIQRSSYKKTQPRTHFFSVRG